MPSHMAVCRHGCNWKCLVVIVRLQFRSLNRFVWSMCGHIRKCPASSLSHWHKGHKVNPRWGWAFDVCSGSLSLMNKRIRLWLPGENNSSDKCSTCQSTWWGHVGSMWVLFGGICSKLVLSVSVRGLGGSCSIWSCLVYLGEFWPPVYLGCCRRHLICWWMSHIVLPNGHSQYWITQWWLGDGWLSDLGDLGHVRSSEWQESIFGWCTPGLYTCYGH